MIEVLAPGAFTTVQDLGRTGMYAIGVPPAGALDGFSARAANLVVGNSERAALLEITYQGPKLLFHGDGVVAATGADTVMTVDGVEQPTWERVPVSGDSVLGFERMSRGARVYLAIAGGVDVEEVLGSRSTYPAIGIGGFRGRPLRKGDRLSVGLHEGEAARSPVALPAALRPQWTEVPDLRVVLGPHDHLIEPESLDLLLGSEWTATPAANRVGYRFKGPRLQFRKRQAPFGAGSDPSNVVDGCYPIGAVQAPAGEELIVLLNDGVTAGGYAILATVISADRDRVAQVRAGDRVRLRAVDLAGAMQARRDRTLRLDRLRTHLSSLS